MFSKEDLNELWKNFSEHIDANMPPRAANCPYCFEMMHPTFDNFGNIFVYCICSEWVLLEEEFKSTNSRILSERPLDEEGDFLEELNG